MRAVRLQAQGVGRAAGAIDPGSGPLERGQRTNMVRMLVSDHETSDVIDGSTPGLERSPDLPDADSAVDQDEIVTRLHEIGIARAPTGQALKAQSVWN
jgi:hypothetical protein